MAFNLSFENVDVNKDGEISIWDVAEISKSYDTDVVPETAHLDINRDSRIDERDVSFIKGFFGQPKEAFNIFNQEETETETETEAVINTPIPVVEFEDVVVDKYSYVTTDPRLPANYRIVVGGIAGEYFLEDDAGNFVIRGRTEVDKFLNDLQRETAEEVVVADTVEETVEETETETVVEDTAIPAVIPDPVVTEDFVDNDDSVKNTQDVSTPVNESEDIFLIDEDLVPALNGSYEEDGNYLEEVLNFTSETARTIFNAAENVVTGFVGKSAPSVTNVSVEAEKKSFNTTPLILIAAVVLGIVILKG
tara:strand:- start:6457 stop:7377 length:921 start_codon:yes stop_codon:yes gene_type:complete